MKQVFCFIVGLVVLSVPAYLVYTLRDFPAENGVILNILLSMLIGAFFMSVLIVCLVLIYLLGETITDIISHLFE